MLFSGLVNTVHQSGGEIGSLFIRVKTFFLRTSYNIIDSVFFFPALYHRHHKVWLEESSCQEVRNIQQKLSDSIELTFNFCFKP